MKILGFKLPSGDEIIAQVVRDEPSMVVIKNPFLVIVNNTQQGLGVNLFPWTLIAKDEIELTDTVARYPVPKDVEDNYIQNTSGIQIVSGAPSQILKG